MLLNSFAGLPSRQLIQCPNSTLFSHFLFHIQEQEDSMFFPQISSGILFAACAEAEEALISTFDERAKSLSITITSAPESTRARKEAVQKEHLSLGEGDFWISFHGNFEDSRRFKCNIWHMGFLRGVTYSRPNIVY